MIDKILGLLNQEGIKYSEELKKELQEAIDSKQFLFLSDKEREIGFFTWITTLHQGIQWVYINNFFIKRGQKFNIMTIRKFMRKKYPNGVYYFHREKTDKYYYTK